MFIRNLRRKKPLMVQIQKVLGLKIEIDWKEAFASVQSMDSSSNFQIKKEKKKRIRKLSKFKYLMRMQRLCFLEGARDVVKGF